MLCYKMSAPDNDHKLGWLNYAYRKIFGGKKQCDAINEVLFYGTNDAGKSIKKGLNNLFCIYYVIIHATRTIDMCVPSLISDTIAKCLITASQKNKVKIKVTIHNSDDFHNLQLFAENGIEVKVIKAQRLEHDFIVIDAGGYEDAVAVVGSIDYEIGRVNCNREATILTSETAVIRSLKNEFDRIWHQRDHL